MPPKRPTRAAAAAPATTKSAASGTATKTQAATASLSAKGRKRGAAITTVDDDIGSFDASPSKKRQKLTPKTSTAKRGPPPPPSLPSRVLNAPPTQRLDVYVLGEAGSGEFGFGTEAPLPDKPGSLIGLPRPLLNTNLRDVVQISPGGVHCAALTADGRIMKWGANDTGNLGRDTTWTADAEEEQEEEGEKDGDDSDSHESKPELNELESTPTVIQDGEFGDTASGSKPRRFAQVVAIDNATFALGQDGTVWGWGTFRDDNGTFGFLKESLVNSPKPTAQDMIQLKPVQIPILQNVAHLAGSTNAMLALTHDGDVYTWGTNGHDELGRPRRALRSSTRYDCLVPERVALPRRRAVSVFAGRHHSFALDDRSRVYAWGANNYAQTGIAPTRAEMEGLDRLTIPAPRRVRALDPNAAAPGGGGGDGGGHAAVVHLAGGSSHSVACCADGTVLTWGRCEDGQGGGAEVGLPADAVELDFRGRPRNLRVPVVVPDIRAWFVAAGGDCSFAITPEGRVYAWGYSECYRTGLGTEENVHTPRMMKRDAKKGSIEETVFTWAGAGGMFSMIAGPAAGSPSTRKR